MAQTDPGIPADAHRTLPIPSGRLFLLLLTCLGFLGPSSASGQVPVTEWRVAGTYPAQRVNREAYPNFYAIFQAPWQSVQTGDGGVLELGSVLSREGEQGSLAIVRHVFWSGEDRVVNLGLEFTGDVDLFFNGWKVFSGTETAWPGAGGPQHGESGITGRGQRNPDTPVLLAPLRFPLYVKAGLNEIFLMVSDGEGGWGFSARTSEPLIPLTRNRASASEVWKTDPVFLTSESVVKDPNRDLLYVSSFDNQYTQKPEPSGFISTLSLQGEILDLKWVDGLHAPTGMDIWKDTLFVAEREDLLAIDLSTGVIAGRWPIPDPVFPNDLVIDDSGFIYISDTRTDDWADSRIYRFRDGRFDIFANEGISRANGLWIRDGNLIVGNSGDGLLKRVELATGRVETILSLGAGIIDGIRVDAQGNYLVSHWEGQVFRITPEGGVEEILDGLPGGWNTADFEYLPEERLILIPTFMDNRVRAFRIGG